MVINAEGFTLWEDHFKRLEEIVPDGRGAFLLPLVRAPRYVIGENGV